MMTNYIFNEKTYIENFLNNQPMENGVGARYIISLLIRYYYQFKGQDNVDKKIILNDLKNNSSFCENNKLQDYELESVVKSVIDKQRKHYKENGTYKPLKQLDYIPLYSGELEYIKSMNTDQEKKFMFTCYIIARFYNTMWVNTSATEIFKLANISKTSKEKDLFIGKLWKEDKISMSDYITSLAIKLKDVKKPDDEIVLKVYEMKNLGHLILATIKPDYKQCERCGKLVKKKGRNLHYCPKCKNIMEKERYKKYNKTRD